MAAISTLSDDFTTKDTSKWTWGTGPTVSGGTAHFAPVDYVNCIVDSAVQYDLTNSAIIFNFSAIQSTAAGDGPFSDILLNSGGITSNRIVWHYEPTGAGTGNLVPRYGLSGGADSDGTSIAYSSNPTTGTTWLRIRHTGTNVLWETSPTGTTWTTRRTVATPFTITALTVTMRGSNNVSNTGSFDVASVNPAAGPVTQTAAATLGVSAALATSAAGNSASTFTDLFTTKDTTLWNFYGTTDVASGHANIPATGYGDMVQGMSTKGTYNLTGASVTWDLDGYVDATASGEAYLWLELATSIAPVTDGMWFFIYQTGTTPTGVEMSYRKAGVDGPVASSTPMPRFMRLRQTGSNVLWEVSTDGTLFATVNTVPTSSLPSLTALRIQMRTNGVGTGSYKVNQVNSTLATPVVPPSAPQSFVATPGVQSAVLTWTAPASLGNAALLTYEITRTGDPTITTVSASTLTYTYTGLTAGTLYTFSVKARNASTSAGLGPAATATATPTFPAPTGVPGPPTAVTAVAGNASAVVSWTAPGTTNGTITTYDVYANGTLRASVAGTITSTTVTGLTNGMQYTFTVIANNTNGPSLASAPSASVTPVVSGSSGSSLYSRAPIGALPPAATQAAIDTLEISIGQALQPVVLEMVLGDALPTALITYAVSRGRRVVLRLSTAGFNTDQLCTGAFDTQINALGTAIEAQAATIFVDPMYEANDWRRPWSPAYGAASPGYSTTLACGTTDTAAYQRAYDHIVRLLRNKTAKVRSIWTACVDPQPQTANENWSAYYPGAVADVIQLQGYNYGVGPMQNSSNQTAWRTAATIFDAPYATAAALSLSKPIWFLTASHDPSTAYTPVGPGFAAGSTVVADTSLSKAIWLNALLDTTSYPRVTALVYYSRSDTRNWALASSPGVTASLKARVPGQGWVLSQVAEDQLGDYVRDSTDKWAAWLASGPKPALRTNEYARPDKKQGVRGSLVFALPYEGGAKQLVNIPVADMLKWNTIHGLLLRQAARNGMQSWAYASGPLPAADPTLMFSGTDTGGRVTYDNSRDGVPGSLMQIEGGMTTATGGTIQATAQPGPPIVSTNQTLTTEYTDPQTMLKLVWAPPTSPGSSQITDYKFFASGPGAFTPEWVSPVVPVASAVSPYVFTNMAPDTQYTIGAIAINNSGDGARGQVTVKTAVPPPPSASGLPAVVRGIYVQTTWSTTYNDPNLAKYNLLLHSFAHANATTGAIPDVNSSNEGIEHTYSGMKAHVDALDAAGTKVILSIGGAGDDSILTIDTELTMFNSLVTLITNYGFKGVDFDLEAAATYTADGLRGISSRLKAKYGANFITTCAPGPGNATYRAWAATPNNWVHPKTGTVLYSGTLCDAIMPQFYDYQTTDAGRQQDMYNEVNSMISAGIPASRIVIGSARPWGSYLFAKGINTGGHHPQVFVDAFNTLKGQGKKIRGLFIWDAGHDRNGNGYSTPGSSGNKADPGTPWLFRDLISDSTKGIF